MNIRELEKELGEELPTQYQAVLQNYPSELRGPIETGELFSSPDLVLSENIAVRARDGIGKDWPPHMLVVGKAGDGDLFTIDNRTEPAAIWFYHKQSGSFTLIASSLSHWLPALQKLAFQAW